MPDRDGWLTEEELLAAAGIGHFTFVRLRALGLVPKSSRQSLGRGVGSTRYLYPPIAIPMIRQAVELRKARMGDDSLFWGLWLDGLPVDIVRWIDQRLKLLLKKVAGRTTPANVNEAARLIARQPAKRTSPHRALFRHLQEQEGR